MVTYLECAFSVCNIPRNSSGFGNWYAWNKKCCWPVEPQTLHDCMYFKSAFSKYVHEFRPHKISPMCMHVQYSVHTSIGWPFSWLGPSFKWLIDVLRGQFNLTVAPQTSVSFVYLPKLSDKTLYIYTNRKTHTIRLPDLDFRRNHDYRSYSATIRNIIM